MDGIRFRLGGRVSGKLRQDPAETAKNQDLRGTKAKCDLNCRKEHKLTEVTELELEEKVSEILWTLSDDKLIPLTVINRRQEYSKLKEAIQDTLKKKLKWRMLASLYHRIQSNAAEAKIPSKEFYLSSSPITNSGALTDHNRARSIAWKMFLKKHRDRMYYCGLNPQRRSKKTVLEGYAAKWSPKRKWYTPAHKMVGKLSVPASPIIVDNDCKTNSQPCERLQRQSTSSLISVDHPVLSLLENRLVRQVEALLRQQGASEGMPLSAIAGSPQIQKCTRQIGKATKIKFVWKRFLAKYQNHFLCSLKCLSRKKTEIIVSLKNPASSEQRVESVTSTFGQDSRESPAENDIDPLASTNEKQEDCYSRNVRSSRKIELELMNEIRQFLIKMRRPKGVPLAFLLRSRDIANLVREMQGGLFDRKLMVHSFLQQYRGEIQYKKKRLQKTKRKGPLLCLRRAIPVKFYRKRLRALKVRYCYPLGAPARTIILRTKIKVKYSKPGGYLKERRSSFKCKDPDPTPSKPAEDLDSNFGKGGKVELPSRLKTSREGATAEETQELPESGLLAKNLTRVPEAILGGSDTENKGSKERRLESVSEDTAKTELKDSSEAVFGVTVEYSAQNGERKTRRFRDRRISRNAFLNSLLQRKESLHNTERQLMAPGNPQTPPAAKSPTESKVDHGSSTKAKFQPGDAKETILQSEVTSSSNFAKTNYDRDVRIQESGYKKASVTHGDTESFAAFTKEDAQNKTSPQALVNTFSLPETTHQNGQKVQKIAKNKVSLRHDCLMKTDKHFGDVKKDQGNRDQDLRSDCIMKTGKSFGDAKKDQGNRDQDLRLDCIMKTGKSFGDAKKDQGNRDQDLRLDCIMKTGKNFGDAKKDQGNRDQDLRRDCIMKAGKNVEDAKNDQGNRDQGFSVANKNTSEDVSSCNQPVHHVQEVKTASQPCSDKIENVSNHEIAGEESKKEQKGPTYQQSAPKTTMNSPAKQSVNVVVDKDAGKSYEKDSRNNTPTRCLPKGTMCIRHDRSNAGAIQMRGRKFQHQGYVCKTKQHAGPRPKDENIPANSSTEHVLTSTFQGNNYGGRGRQRGGGRSNFRRPRGRGNWGRGQRPTESIGAKYMSCEIGSQGKLRNQNQYVATAVNPETSVNEEFAKPTVAKDQQNVSRGDMPLIKKLSGSSGLQCVVEVPPSNPRRKAFEKPSFSGLGRISAAAIKGVLSQDCAQADQNKKVDRDSTSSKADSRGASVEKEPVSAVSSYHGRDSDVIRPNQKQPVGIQSIDVTNVGSDGVQPAPDQPVCTNRNESIHAQSGGPDVAALLHQGYEEFLVKRITSFLQENPGFQEIRTLCDDEEVFSILQVMRKSEAFTDWRSFLNKYSSIFNSMYVGRKGYIQIRE